MAYLIEVTLPDHDIWFQPSEVDPRLNDFEPTLDAAIKAERFFQRSCGWQTRRTQIVEEF